MEEHTFHDKVFVYRSESTQTQLHIKISAAHNRTYINICMMCVCGVDTAANINIDSIRWQSYHLVHRDIFNTSENGWLKYEDEMADFPCSLIYSSIFGLYTKLL